ncbi:uncharacterized protein G2W53_007932 [Senna tora]|uniref:Uncharacterized protein n=1 Tax=Senna tora TaxID=362788 RepID=A0A834X7K8_9FABA|nr:uncharacterized protein G2W53_007932 [Senna tora]
MTPNMMIPTWQPTSPSLEDNGLDVAALLERKKSEHLARKEQSRIQDLREYQPLLEEVNNLLACVSWLNLDREVHDLLEELCSKKETLEAIISRLMSSVTKPNVLKKALEDPCADEPSSPPFSPSSEEGLETDEWHAAL